MATTTHRGITYTSSGSATMQVQLDLPLQAGVDQDETTWFGPNYPGTLDAFAARQTDGANRMQPRLLAEIVMLSLVHLHMELMLLRILV